MTAALLVKRAGADEYGSKIKALIAGEPGSGKTRIASTWPDPIYANAEGGLMSVVDRQPHFVDIATLDDLALLFVALRRPPAEQEKLLGFVPKTLVLDTVDEIQRMAARQRLDETKKESLAIQDFGWLGDQMRGIIRAARNLDMHVVMTIHTKPDKDEETGRILIKPQLQGAMADEIASYVDLALLLKTQQTTRVIDGQSRRVEVRVLQTVSDANHTWLKDRSGKLARPDFEVNLEDDFERIHARMFGGATLGASAETGSIAAPPKTEPEPVVTKPKAAAAKRTPAAVSVEPESPPEPEPTSEATPELDVAPVSDTPAASSTSSEALPSRARETAEDLEPAGEETHEETVPDGGTEEADDMTCEVCGAPVESEDQRDLSKIRFRRSLCRADFLAAKKR